MSQRDRRDDAAEALLGRYAELLRSSPHNLLSPRGLAELEARHFPESVAFAGVLPNDACVLDVGSGGGLPGMVIAIVRADLTVHLMEATRKKADFLVETAAALELDVTVHHGRAEELSSTDLGGAFDAVTARAVAPLERLVPWCAPYLRPGGRLFAIKGERWSEELAQAGPALTASRMSVHALPTADSGGSTDTTGGPRVVVLERATTPGRGRP